MVYIKEFPYTPLQMDKETSDFLNSLEERINRVDVATVVDDSILVLGTRFINAGFLTDTKGEFHDISYDKALSKLNDRYFIPPSGTLYHLGVRTKRIKERIRKLKEYEWKFRYCVNRNLKEVDGKIKPIRIYQLSIDELQTELGITVERVDTGLPETFLRGENVGWNNPISPLLLDCNGLSSEEMLRAQAYLLGADAIAHYQPGSSIGTPVRFKKRIN